MISPFSYYDDGFDRRTQKSSGRGWMLINFDVCKSSECENFVDGKIKKNNTILDGYNCIIKSCSKKSECDKICLLPKKCSYLPVQIIMQVLGLITMCDEEKDYVKNIRA